MTTKEKFYANETRADIFIRDDYTCRTCGASIYLHGTPQLAHRIAQTKGNLERFGSHVIHHPLNMASVCSLDCNSRQNIGMSPRMAEALEIEILGAISAQNCMD